MHLHRSNYLPRDFSHIRRIMMRIATSLTHTTILIHQMDNLITFSVKTDHGEESYPMFFSTKDDLLIEASNFLSQYALTLKCHDEHEKKYTVCN